MAYTIGTTPVGFYRGSSDNLNKLSDYKAGAFYITTDTDRLYYAQSSTNLVQLNKSIQVVEAFPTSGQLIGEFYYNSNTAQLAYYAGKVDGKDSWVHVNYYENTVVDSIDISDAKIANDKSCLEFDVSLILEDKEGKHFETPITDTFKITKEQINELVDHPDIPNLDDIQVKLTSTVDTSTQNGSVTLDMDGTGSVSSPIIIHGSGTTRINGGGNNIIISTPSHVLENKVGDNSDPTTSLFLKTNEGGILSQVILKAGTDVVLTPDANKITFDHASYEGTSKDANITTGVVANGGTITVVKGVELSNGHVTDIHTDTFTLPTIPDDEYLESISANNQGQLVTTMKSGKSTTHGQDLYYVIDNETYYNQANLTDAIKTLIGNNLSKVTNAMTFRGGLVGGATEEDKVSIENTLDITNAHIGDVYIIQSGYISITDSYDNESLGTAGDIVILNGEEDPDTGCITTESLKYILIEGTEKDTTYELIGNENRIYLQNQEGQNLDSISVNGDDVITATVTNNAFAITHKTFDGGVNVAETASALTYGQEFDVITDYNKDNYGHVEQLIATKFKLPALPDYIHHLNGDATNKVVHLQDGDGKNRGSIKLANGNTIEINCNTVADDSGEKNTSFTINHATVQREDNLATAAQSLSKTFEVVTAVSSNDEGHITGIETQKYTPINYTLNEKVNVVDGNNNIVTAETLLQSTAGWTTGVASLKITSQNDNLTIARDGAETNQINFGLVWGEF